MTTVKVRMNIKTKLLQRWTDTDLIQRVAKILRTTHGELPTEISPFGMHEGRVDLRGFAMPKPATMDGLLLKDVDFTGAQLWLFHPSNCRFENVVFDMAMLDDSNDEGNEFRDCRYIGASFVGARLGYKGSQYHSCVFERCNFAHAGGIRAEFYGCRFINCKLKGLDFYGSSFENCAFEGLLEDVWFRGEFPAIGRHNDERMFGKPKKNRMLNVSFAKADPHDLTFSDDCDLATVVLPERGDFHKYCNWKERLIRLQSQAMGWPEPNKSEALLFVKVFLTHAENQSWMILGVEDVRSNFAPHTAARIIQDLDRPI